MNKVLTFLIFFASLLYSENRHITSAPWVISGSIYPLKTKDLSQIEFTKEFRHINIADFWIDKLPAPHKILATSNEIEAFNAKAFARFGIASGFADFNKTYKSEWLIGTLEHLREYLTKRAFFLEDGRTLSVNYIQSLHHNASIETIVPNIEPQLALTTEYTNQRLLPSNNTLLKSTDQIYFDRNQNAALDIGTPLVLLHQSRDKKWYFALSSTSYGWVEASNIAFASQEQMDTFAKSKDFVVTISAKNAFFIDGKYRDFVRMGVRLPYLGENEEQIFTLIPTRDTHGVLVLENATFNRLDIHRGYLKYTQANIIKQAFKFLNAPYGWGGMFGEQDCSKFTQMIFNSVGIALPRNSSEQVEVASLLIEFAGDRQNRLEQLKRAKPASTLLHLSGHITLYLGAYKDKHYMIHTLWGAKNGKNPIAKTLVTTVDLNDYIDAFDVAVSIP